MTHRIEAIYEGGLLRPVEPLALKEHEKVQLVVYAGPSRARETAGLMGWTGSAELAQQFATGAELSFPPPEET